MKSLIIKTIKPALLASTLLLTAVSPVRGHIIYRTGFEAPAFVAGQPLAGQDGWIAPSVLSPDAAVATTAKPRQGKQTVRVLGGDLVHQDFIGVVTGGYYDAIGSYRHPVNYDTGGNEAVRVSANVRVDGPRTATGNNFFSAGLAALAVQINPDGTTSPSGVGELAISSDGHVYSDSEQNLVPIFLSSARVTLGEWHNLAIEVDFAARAYSFFVDDEWLGTFAFDPSVNSNIFLRGSLTAYAAPDTATMHKTDYSAHYDRFVIEAESDCDEQE